MLVNRALKYVAVFACVIVSARVAALGQQDCKPITRGGLMRSFEVGKRQRKTATDYVKLINLCDVNFSLTPEDEQKIRRSGKYLGKKGLDDLISAIRSNYRVEASDGNQPSRPTVEKINYTSDVISSQREDLPYGLQLTIQTNVVIEPTNLRVECDGPIGWADFDLASTGSVSTSILRGVQTAIRGNTYAFSFDDAFRPQRPIIVTLFSATKISVMRVVHKIGVETPAQVAPSDVKIGLLQCSASEYDRGYKVLKNAVCIAKHQQTGQEFIGNVGEQGHADINVPYGFYVVTIKAEGYITRVEAVQVGEQHGSVVVELQKAR